MTETARLVCISDTHNKAHHIPDLPSGDILIHAGDATNMGNAHELTDFFEWVSMQRRRFSSVIFVPGNHDGLHMESDPDFARKRPVQFPGTIITNGMIDVGGLKIYGFAYTPTFGDWSYMADYERMVGLVNDIDRTADVLVSHGPAFGVLDKNGDRENCGCPLLLSAVNEMNSLQAHVFGHIHESHGKRLINGSVRANVSICDGRYRPVNPATVIDVRI